jgi:hypothetical protein
MPYFLISKLLKNIINITFNVDPIALGGKLVLNLTAVSLTYLILN